MIYGASTLPVQGDNGDNGDSLQTAWAAPGGTSAVHHGGVIHTDPCLAALLCTTVELPIHIHVWLLYCGGASSEVSPSLSCSEETLIAPSHCLGLAVNYRRLEILNVQRGVLRLESQDGIASS